ncbi:hypothetical protein F5146DRAFT_32191 [Armillaria mellea]|nr:hypothetical protein F5146DRAFT_32191 [Armillaria mellea]
MLNALNTGHLIIFFSTAFFLIASYAVLARRIPSSDGYSSHRHLGSRHTLQVLCCLPSPDKRLLCDCQLGRLAVLSQHLGEAIP